MSIYWLIFIVIVIFWFLGSGSSVDKNSVKMSFTEAKYIIALVAKVAKSDGRITKVEAELISQILDDLKMLSGCTAIQREELKTIYNIEKEDVTNAFSIASEYKRRFSLDSLTCVNRVHFLLNLAYIDGEFSQAERKIMDQICDGFEINDFVKKAIFSKFEQSYKAQGGYQHYGGKYEQNNYKTPPKKDPYEVLGITQNSSFEEIRAKYRELVKKYHPDILMGKGADSEIIQEGTKKLQEINEAYEIIKERLGK